MEPEAPELFHRIAQPDSAAVRRRMSELGVALDLRNVDFDSHREALARLGGGETPAVWDGARLHVGRAACLSALEAMARV